MVFLGRAAFLDYARVLLGFSRRDATKNRCEYADDLVKFIGPRNAPKVIIDPSAASFKAEMTKRGIWRVDAEDDVNEVRYFGP